MTHIDLPELIQKLQQDVPLDMIERVFLMEILRRLWTTDDLDHVSNTPKSH